MLPRLSISSIKWKKILDYLDLPFANAMHVTWAYPLAIEGDVISAKGREGFFMGRFPRECVCFQKRFSFSEATLILTMSSHWKRLKA